MTARAGSVHQPVTILRFSGRCMARSASSWFAAVPLSFAATSKRSRILPPMRMRLLLVLATAFLLRPHRILRSASARVRSPPGGSSPVRQYHNPQRVARISEGFEVDRDDHASHPAVPATPMVCVIASFCPFWMVWAPNCGRSRFGRAARRYRSGRAGSGSTTLRNPAQLCPRHKGCCLQPSGLECDAYPIQLIDIFHVFSQEPAPWEGSSGTWADGRAGSDAGGGQEGRDTGSAQWQAGDAGGFGRYGEFPDAGDFGPIPPTGGHPQTAGSGCTRLMFGVGNTPGPIPLRLGRVPHAEPSEAGDLPDPAVGASDSRLHCAYRFRPMGVAGFPPSGGLVGVPDLADAVGHQPRGFPGDAGVAVPLHGRNAPLWLVHSRWSARTPPAKGELGGLDCGAGPGSEAGAAIGATVGYPRVRTFVRSDASASRATAALGRTCVSRRTRGDREGRESLRFPSGGKIPEAASAGGRIEARVLVPPVREASGGRHARSLREREVGQRGFRPRPAERPGGDRGFDFRVGRGRMVATVTRLGAAAPTVHYFERDGYYAKDDAAHRRASRWRGSGAAALGLRGPVRPKWFNEVLSGRVPGTDIRLGRLRGGKQRAPRGRGRDLLPRPSPSPSRAWCTRPAPDAGPGGAGARRGRPGDIGFHRTEPPADAGLGSGDAPPTARSGERDGCGDIPARGQPQPGSAAAHALRDREHDAERVGRLAERGVHGAGALAAPDRRLLPFGTPNTAGGARLRDGTDLVRRHGVVRDRGLSAVPPGRVFDPPAGGAGVDGGARLGAYAGPDAAGGAVHAQAEGRAGPGGAGGGVAAAGGRVPAARRGGGAGTGPDRAAAGPGGVRPRDHGPGRGASRGAYGGLPCDEAARARPVVGGARPRSGRRGGRAAAVRRSPDRRVPAGGGRCVHDRPDGGGGTRGAGRDAGRPRFRAPARSGGGRGGASRGDRSERGPAGRGAHDPAFAGPPRRGAGLRRDGEDGDAAGGRWRPFRGTAACSGLRRRRAPRGFWAGMRGFLHGRCSGS